MISNEPFGIVLLFHTIKLHHCGSSYPKTTLNSEEPPKSQEPYNPSAGVFQKTKKPPEGGESGASRNSLAFSKDLYLQ